jgi:hypothetical protein
VELSADGKFLCVIASCSSAELGQEVIGAEELGKAFTLRINYIARTEKRERVMRAMKGAGNE